MAFAAVETADGIQSEASSTALWFELNAVRIDGGPSIRILCPRESAQNEIESSDRFNLWM